MKKTFALVGCGHIAHRHVTHIVNHDLGALVGVYDLDEQVGANFALRYGVKNFSSLSELLKDKSIDVVNICTPNGTHAEIAIQVMHAGKHVVVEKPMAISSGAARKMEEVSLSQKVKMFVVKQNHDLKDALRAWHYYYYYYYYYYDYYYYY